MKRSLGAVLIMMAVVVAAFAQETVSGQNAADLFGAETFNISMSPDGTKLVGFDRFDNTQLCIVTIATGDKQCYSLEDTFGSSLSPLPYFNPLVWSPDSTTLLFTESFDRAMLESDLWTMDTATGEITNLTDDGIDGSYLNPDTAGFLLDHFPAYAPNGDIYFFRIERPESSPSDYILTLQRLAVGTDMPEVVSDLSSTLPNLSIYYSPVISPNGSQIVFPVQARDSAAPENGLWLLDLESGEAQQLTDTNDSYVGLPESQQQLRLYTLNPVWTGDGTGVVFQASTLVPSTDDFPGQNFLYVDVDGGEVTPLVDLSDFSMQLGDAELESQLLRIPRDGAVSADGSTFVYLAFDVSPTNGRVAAVSLPPDGSEPTIIGDVEFTPIPYVPNSIMSPDGKALLGGWLYSLQ